MDVKILGIQARNDKNLGFFKLNKVISSGKTAAYRRLLEKHYGKTIYLLISDPGCVWQPPGVQPLSFLEKSKKPHKKGFFSKLNAVKLAQ